METKELAEHIKNLSEAELAELNEHLAEHGLHIRANDSGGGLPPDPTHRP